MDEIIDSQITAENVGFLDNCFDNSFSLQCSLVAVKEYVTEEENCPLPARNKGLNNKKSNTTILNRTNTSGSTVAKAVSLSQPPKEKLINKNLKAWGLPAEIARKYEQKGITEMFEWQVTCLANSKVLLECSNLVYSAPTSAGKTLVAEILTIKTILERQKKVIIILPFVSIVREKMFYLQDILSSSGIRVEGFMGSQSPPGGLQAVHVAICTIEKANSLVNRLLDDGNISELGAVIVDELHLLGDPHRGYILELLLTKIKYVSSKSDDVQIQIIGMSATLPNLEVLADWLSAELFVTQFRPIPLDEFCLVGNKFFDKTGKTVKNINVMKSSVTDSDNVLNICLNTIKDGYSILIFCMTKNRCENLAQSLASSFYSLGCQQCEFGSVLRGQLNTEKISEVLEQLKNCPVGLDQVLMKTISFGVAYHHAGLTFDERDIIEGAFKSGAIRVLVATSTLSSGVNLPARVVIIRSPVFMRQPINILTYKQMSGRAGRMGKDNKGESILICTEAEKKIGFDLMMGALDPVKSCIESEDKYMRAVLEMIASQVVCTKEDLDLYSKCTLLSTQQEGSTSQDKLMENTLKELKNYELVRLQEDGEALRYVATPLGKACLSASMAPNDGLSLFLELQKARQCLVLETDLHLIYLVTPYSVSSQWGEIDWLQLLTLWESLTKAMKKVGELVGVQESFIIRCLRGTNKMNNAQNKLNIHKRFYTALALQDLVNEVPLSEVANKFQCARGFLQSLQQAAATFAGMVTAFSHQLGWKNMEILVSQFQDRLHFGIHSELLELMKLSTLNGVRARALFDSGYETIISVASADVNEIENILHKAVPFQSEKEREDDDSDDVKKRNKIKSIWITGCCGMTAKDAAQNLIIEARKYLENEIGVGNIKWNNSVATNGDKKTEIISAELERNIEHEKHESPVENVNTGLNPVSQESKPRKISLNILDNSSEDLYLTANHQSDVQENVLIKEDITKNITYLDHTHVETTNIKNMREIKGNKTELEDTNVETTNIKNMRGIKGNKTELEDPNVESMNIENMREIKGNKIELENTNVETTNIENMRGIRGNKTELEDTNVETTNIENTREIKIFKNESTLISDNLLCKTVKDEIVWESLNFTEAGIVNLTKLKEPEKTFSPNISFGDTDKSSNSMNIEKETASFKCTAMKDTSLFSTDDDSSIFEESLPLDLIPSKLFDNNNSPLVSFKRETTADFVNIASSSIMNAFKSPLVLTDEDEDIKLVYENASQEEFDLLKGDEVNCSQENIEDVKTFISPYKRRSEDKQNRNRNAKKKKIDHSVSTDSKNSPSHIPHTVKTFIKIKDHCYDCFLVRGIEITKALRILKNTKTAAIYLSLQKKSNNGNDVIGSNILNVQKSDIEETLPIKGFAACLDQKTCLFIDLKNTETLEKNAIKSWLEKGPTLFKTFSLKWCYMYLKKWLDISLPYSCEDVKLTEWLIDSDERKIDIEYLMKRYLYLDLSPAAIKVDKRTEIFGKEESNVDACVKAWCVWMIAEKQEASLRNKNDVPQSIRGTQNHVAVILAKCEHLGITVNRQLASQMLLDVNRALECLQKKADKLAGCKINLNSSKAVAKVLGLSRNSTSKVSTRKSVLTCHNSPLSSVVMYWRKLNSILTKTLYPLTEKAHGESKDDKIRPTYTMHTCTGRISMHEPNLQNVPRTFSIPSSYLDGDTAEARLRTGNEWANLRTRDQGTELRATNKGAELNCNNQVELRTNNRGTEKTYDQIESIEFNCRHIFKASPGHVMISADYCQLEMRVLTHFSEDSVLLRIMRSGEDVFKSIASSWSNLPEDEVDEDLRQKAKQLCYGILYGMGNKTLSQHLDVTELEAAFFMESFFKTFPHVRQYTQRIVEECRKVGYVETLMKRRRYLPNISAVRPSLKSAAERQAVNTTIQGSAADIAKAAMCTIDNTKHPHYEPRLLLQMHDELIYEVPEVYEENFMKTLKQAMEGTIKLKVPLPVKVKTGHSWGTMKEVKLH